MRLHLDELVRRRDARRFANLLVRRIGDRVADVLADRGAEQQVLLEGDPDLGAEALELEGAQIDTASGSNRRSSSATSVLLPEPVGPISAVIVPTRASRSMSWRTGASR